MRNPLRDIQRLVAALRRLRPFMPFTRGRLAAVAGTMVTTTVLEVVGVGLLAQLLNIVLGTTSSGSRMVRLAGRWAPQASPVKLSIIFAGLIVVVIAVKNASSYLNTTLMARIERESVENLRRTLFARLQTAPLEVFEQHAPAALSNLFVEETRRAMECMTVLFGMIQTAATAGLFFIALIWISPPLAVATLAVGIVAALLVSRLYRFFGRLGRGLTEANMRLMRTSGEAFNGVRVVRAVHAQDAMAARFGAASEEQARTDERYRRGTAVLLPLVETGSIAAALALLIGSFALLVTPGHMSQAKLTAFGLVLLRLVPLVNRYSGTQAHLLYLAGSLREIGRWLETPRFPVRAFGTARFEGIRRAITVRDLSYRYLPSKPALREVSFEIPAGATVALVGRSGSGKSTLATLLMRLREPGGGAVLVDGADYWTFSPASWHAGVALVEQEPFLFNDTLGANVAFGFEGATPDDIEFALHVAHLDDFLDTLPDRLETPIGERGVMLSGGQRQRLSIARAIVRNPKFLILDEATSNLDTVSEQMVQAALEAAIRGRTTLVIAHRLSTVRRADRIVVLEEGGVAEIGTWDELVARGGAFAELVQKGLDAGR